MSLTKWIGHETLLLGIIEGKFNEGKIELKMMNLIVKDLMKMMTRILAKGDMVDSLEKHGKEKMIIWAVIKMKIPYF